MPEIVYLYASIRDELKTQKVKPQQAKISAIFDEKIEIRERCHENGAKECIV